MEIVLNIENLINDMGSKFLMETQSTDPIPPKGTLIQCLNEANVRLVSMLGRFVILGGCETAYDDLGAAQSFLYQLNLSQRRGSGKSQSFADVFHSYMVNAALAKALSSMGAGELSAKHEQQSIADAELIDKLIHSKLPPIL